MSTVLRTRKDYQNLSVESIPDLVQVLVADRDLSELSAMSWCIRKTWWIMKKLVSAYTRSPVGNVIKSMWERQPGTKGSG